jgi:hypothetical protein
MKERNSCVFPIVLALKSCYTWNSPVYGQAFAVVRIDCGTSLLFLTHLSRLGFAQRDKVLWQNGRLYSLKARSS